MFRDNTKKTGVVNLLHGEVPDVPSELASAGGAAGELWPAVAADKMPCMTLQYGWQNIVKAHRTLKKAGEV